MDIIETWHSPNGFSWITIERDENDTYFIFTNNKKGLHKQEFYSNKFEVIYASFCRRVNFALKMNKSIQDAIENLKNNPEALERLKNKKEIK